MSITYSQIASQKDFKKEFKNIGKEIKNSKNIAILMHTSPDMDCLGSAFGLREALILLGKKVQIFSDEILPHEAYKVLPCENISSKKIDNQLFDLIISVDTSTLSRLGSYEESFKNAKNSIAIDHHMNGDIMGKIQLVNSKYCSCAEIILDLINNLKIKLTENIATYLYSGLASDSGSFKNTNVTSDSFKHACILRDAGARANFVNDNLFRENTPTQIQMKKFLYNNYKIIDDKFAVIVVTLKDLKAIGANNQDCNTFSIELLSIEGVKISCSIMQMEEKVYKISFRSRSEYIISDFAWELGGGGHKNAA